MSFDSGGIIGSASDGHRGGQIVRVIDGPFTGFRGEVKEVDEQTAKVAVQVFGRVTPMDLALGQIELVPENSN